MTNYINKLVEEERPERLADMTDFCFKIKPDGNLEKANGANPDLYWNVELVKLRESKDGYDEFEAYYSSDSKDSEKHKFLGNAGGEFWNGL